MGAATTKPGPWAAPARRRPAGPRLPLNKVVLLGAVGALVLMAAEPVAADSTMGQDRLNGSRACAVLQASLGPTTFDRTYGTNVSRSNAVGVCVSRWTKVAHSSRHAAASACAGEQGKTAVANCVRLKTRASLARARRGTQQAAQQCVAERGDLKVTAVEAFRTCISTKLVAQNLTLTDAVGSLASELYPGGSGDVSFRVTNSNAFAVTITGVAANGAVTSGNPRCITTGVTFITTTGLMWRVGAGATVTFTLAGKAVMSNASPNSCQGASFRIPVTLTATR